MEREEVELLPAGLITCLLNNKEVRIVKISPKTLTVRLEQEIEDIRQLKVAFYIFDKNKYEEIAIEQYDLINKVKHEFYITYDFSINDEMYLKSIRKLCNYDINTVICYHGGVYNNNVNDNINILANKKY